jgi:hypothetical protein
VGRPPPSTGRVGQSSTAEKEKGRSCLGAAFLFKRQLLSIAIGSFAYFISMGALSRAASPICSVEATGSRVMRTQS